MSELLTSRTALLREKTMLVARAHRPLSRLAPPSRLWGYTLHRGLASGTAPTGDEGGLPDAEASRREPLVVDNTRIIETELRFEAEKSYMAYAMSVIIGRALPDVRDGLKPVHRRILYAMHELKLVHSKPFKKCARVVGEVLGKFHPHGDTAVYDALVRLAQDFSMRAPLVDGHGNFGSLDDDPPAAMRYTECRLQALAEAMLLQDIDAGTVDYAPNFDASHKEPTVLPSRLPHLLINGASGIAVGIATKIPPHNMGEVVAGLKALIRDPAISVEALMRHIPAPDFPTGGEIIMGEGVKEAYTKGRGGIVVRAKMHIEDPNSPQANGAGAGTKKRARRSGVSKPAVVITELPYQSNKASLVEQIARLVDSGTITGVSDVRDESDRDGMRVVVEVKRGSSPELVLNQLMKHTGVESRFSCNMVALVGATPRTLNLKEFLTHFLDFRCTIVERRAQHELQQAEQRLHKVDGYLLALGNMDAVIATIRQASDGTASQQLQAQFGLSEEQAKSVLGMTLRQLTSMEEKKLADEQASLRAKIADLNDLLAKRERILGVVEAEADELVAKYGTPRRTAILSDGGRELTQEDITPNAPSLVVYSRKGYVKRMSADTFTVQGLRGRGKAGAKLKQDDMLEEVVFVNDHDHLLFFTEDGQAYSLKAYDIPEGGRTAIGTAVAQLLPIDRSTPIAAMVPVSEFQGDAYLVLLTRSGLIKRTPLVQFGRMTAAGKMAVKLREGDALQFVGLCQPSDTILIAASDGNGLHFRADYLRPMARSAMGNKSMNLKEGSSIVAMSVLPSGLAEEEEGEEGDDAEEGDAAAAAAGEEGEGEAEGSSSSGAVGMDMPWLLLVTAKGLGKRVPISQLPVRRSRTGKGMKVVNLGKGDHLAAATVVGALPSEGATSSGEWAGSEGPGGSSSGRALGQDVVVSTAQGQLVRLSLDDIKIQRRTTKGVRVIKLSEGDEVSSATVLRTAGGK